MGDMKQCKIASEINWHLALDVQNFDKGCVLSDWLIDSFLNQAYT